MSLDGVIRVQGSENSPCNNLDGSVKKKIAKFVMNEEAIRSLFIEQQQLLNHFFDNLNYEPIFTFCKVLPNLHRRHFQNRV